MNFIKLRNFKGCALKNFECFNDSTSALSTYEISKAGAPGEFRKF